MFFVFVVVCWFVLCFFLLFLSCIFSLIKHGFVCAFCIVVFFVCVVLC